jgi:hypothetical protein
LYVRQVLGLSSASFGLMMGVIGAGAVLGGLMMPQLHRLFSRNNLIMLAGASCSLALVPLAVIPGVMTAYAALLVFGIGWIVGASNLQATVQLATAPWVRARVLALYQAVFNGGMGLGAIFWGALGEHAGLPGTIFAAGLGGGVIALLTRAVQLPAEIGDPSAPAISVPRALSSAPAISVPRALSISEEMAPLLHSARHRLLLAISYHVHPATAAAFRSAMVEVRLSRYRDGAVGWALSRDVSDPTHRVETFRTRDWHELQRGFERLNLADSREDQCLREPPTRHSQRHGSGPCRTVQRGAHCQQDSQRQQERGIRRPSAATSARITAAASISMLVRIRWRLRSIKSAKAPAGSARTSTGSCAAAGTKLTINGLGDRSVMIQALAVFWIQVPRAEIVLASHSQKNARLANGAPAECAVRSGSSAE